jgi:Cdc6-like AAA superfamily ATPase
MRKEVFSLLDNIMRGQLIGRESEMSELEGFWNRAERGEGHLVLLSGEPGIGKTRLVEELTAPPQCAAHWYWKDISTPNSGDISWFARCTQDYLRSLSAEQYTQQSVRPHRNLSNSSRKWKLS